MPSKIISSTPRRSPRLHKNSFVLAAPKKTTKKIVKVCTPKALTFLPEEKVPQVVQYLPPYYPPQKCDSVCAPWSDEEDY